MATIEKISYGASVAFSMTNVNSLPTSPSIVTLRALAAVSNTSALIIDALVSGVITVGTITPAAGMRIEIWAYAAYDDTPTYIAPITGADVSAAFATEERKRAKLRLLSAMPVATSAVQYGFAPVSIAEAFGAMPTHWGIAVGHNTGANLSASGNAIAYTPIQYQSV